MSHRDKVLRRVREHFLVHEQLEPDGLRLYYLPRGVEPLDPDSLRGANAFHSSPFFCLSHVRSKKRYLRVRVI